jgi:hypothetical protein
LTAERANAVSVQLSLLNLRKAKLYFLNFWRIRGNFIAVLYVVSRKFLQKVQTIAATEVERKSPFSPFEKAGISPCDSNPFKKRGDF